MLNFVSYITYMLNEKMLGRGTFVYSKELIEAEQFSGKELEEFQYLRLRNLLTHAYSYTDHYKELFDKTGIEPANIKNSVDLSRVPFLIKSDIRNRINRFISKDKKRRLVRYATSGSTGHPLIFYLSKERVAGNKAAYLMLYNWWKLRIGDREVVLWGSSRDVSAYSIAKKIRDSLLQTRLLPAFQMNESTMHKYIGFIKEFKPKDIFGYAHSIYLLARFARNRGLRLDDIGIKVVFTTAELLHDFQRKLIEEVFGCRVSNCYGGRDSGLISFECPEGGMHLNPYIITEIVRDGVPVGPGEKGEIVITDLNSYGMPFIRYKTGDEGILGDGRICKCGRVLPVLKDVFGRNTDYIVNPKGGFIHPLALEYIFRDIEGIDYFKIIQKKEDMLVIEMVTSQRFDKNLEPVIMDKIFQVMGQPISVTFRYIKEDDINKKEDKYKFVVSEIIDKYR